MSGVSVVLSLCAAAFYGAGDFCGGVATRRSQILATVATSHLIGLVTGALALGLVPAPHVGAADLAWGSAGGLVGGVGVAFLYLSLARGTMSVVAPITASTAAVLPVFIGMGLGERPSAVALFGVVLAVCAIALLSMDHAPARADRRRANRAALLMALSAGAAFAVLFTFWSRTSSDSGMWPLVAARATSSGGALLIAAATRRPAIVSMPAMGITVLAGVLDMVANVCYLLAVRHGLLSLVAVLTSLYPATTVILAMTLLGERIVRVQRAGLALALVAIALIVA